MSLKATFYTTASPKNRLEKEVNSDATQSFEVEVNLLYPTDLLRPTLIVSDFNQNDDCFSYNYVKLVFSGTHQITRYYFITGWQILKNNLYQVSLKEDVLMTYEAEILAENLFVERCASGSRVDIYDPLVPHSYYLSQSFLPLTTTDTGTNLDVTFSNESDTSAINYIIVASTGVEAEASDLGNNTLTNQYTDPLEEIDMGALHPSVAVYACDASSAEAFLMYYKKNGSSLSGALLGVYKYPFPLKDSNGNGVVLIPNCNDGELYIAGEKKTISTKEGIKYWLLDERYSYRILGNYSNVLYNYLYSYLSDNPVFEMFVPYYGYVTLDTSWFADNSNKYYSLIYMPIWWSDQCMVFFTDRTAKKVLWHGVCQIAQPISVTESNIQQFNEKYATLAVKSVISSLTSLLGIAYGTPSQQTSGVKGLVGVVGNIASTAITTHINTSADTYIPSEGLSLPQDPYIRMTTAHSLADYEWVRIHGKPMMDICLLSSLRSSSDNYVKCNIQYLPTEIGNDAERNEIISLLNQGIILPAKSSS